MSDFSAKNQKDPGRIARGLLLWGRVGGLYLFSLSVLLGSLHRLTGVFAGVGTDPRYLAHPALTALHLLPGFVFFLLGPLQFLPRRGRWHRWRGRVFVGSGLLSGAGVIGMVWVFPALGGLLTQLVTTAVNLAVAGLMLLAIWAIRRKKLPLHAASMRRAYALGLSVATARWFILAAGVFGIGFDASFVIASALGLILNVVVIEVALRHSRSA